MTVSRYRLCAEPVVLYVSTLQVATGSTNTSISYKYFNLCHFRILYIIGVSGAGLVGLADSVATLNMADWIAAMPLEKLAGKIGWKKWLEKMAGKNGWKKWLEKCLPGGLDTWFTCMI